MLKIDRLDTIFSYINDGSNIKIDKKDPFLPNSAVLNELVDILAEFACLDRHVYCNLDGKSLATIRLEKTLIKK